MAGNFFPSTNSKKAPPAVDTYERLFSIPYDSIAAIVSPPPAKEKAIELATACAKVSVPLANCLNSKTPIGPFHKIVFACLIYSETEIIDLGPKSKIISSSDTS